MSYLQKLLDKYCPNGYEWVKLGDIAEIGTGNSNRSDAKIDGKYDLFVRSKDILKTNKFEYDDESILVPGEGGIGEIFHYVNGKYALHQRVYRVHIIKNNISHKFLYYLFVNYFKSYIQQKAVSATVTSLRKPMFDNFEIPLIPLKIQEKIVEILERFRILEAELKAELEARGKQFDFWKKSLFNFNNFINKKISNICKITRGKVISKKFISDNAGEYPVYSSQTINDGNLGNINTYDFEGEYISWTTDGANAGTIFYRKGRFNVTNVCGLLKVLNNKEINSKFLYYALSLVSKDYVNYDNSNPKLMSNVMADIELKIPPLEVQNKIVSILDKLSEYSQEINSGLPAEIELRSKQFKYYRDRLLDFK